MIPETVVLGQVLAPIVSGLVVIVLYHYIGQEYLGADENGYWNTFRRTLLSAGDSTVRKKTNFALLNSAKAKEFVGTIDMNSNEFAHALESQGYAQGVLSGLKYRPQNVDPNTSSEAEFEAGSMVFRESKSDALPDALAMRQVHVFWFETASGIDVYAHEEYSSLNPFVAWRHYKAKTQNASLGKEVVRADLSRAGVEIKQ